MTHRDLMRLRAGKTVYVTWPLARDGTGRKRAQVVRTDPTTDEVTVRLGRVTSAGQYTGEWTDYTRTVSAADVDTEEV